MRDNLKGGALTETTFLVLLATYEPNHGYRIRQIISDMTDGRLVLGSGTLYGAINALLKKEWIIPYDKEENEDERRNTYIVSEKGKAVAEQELERLRLLVSGAEEIINSEKKPNGKKRLKFFW